MSPTTLIASPILEKPKVNADDFELDIRIIQPTDAPQTPPQAGWSNDSCYDASCYVYCPCDTADLSCSVTCDFTAC